MSEFDKKPLLKLARIYQRKSKTGSVYFVGRLGFNKILIFKDEKASEGSDNPVWNVLLQETDYNPEQKTENAPLSRKQEIQRGMMHRPL